MAYAITQNDIRLLMQSEKKISLRLDLLNSEYRVIDRLESRLLSSNFSTDSDSAVRRNYNCVFYADSPEWQVGKDKKIWIENMIRPYVGYTSAANGETTYYKVGTFKVNTSTFTYNSTTNTVSLDCLDLMCQLDGTLGGTLGGDELGISAITIERGANIRNAVIAILKTAGITQYDVCSFNREVPYDIEVSPESTYYSLLEELLNLYSGYEFFFDEDGIFTVRLKPQLFTDADVLEYSIIKPLVIDEQRTIDFSKVRNSCEVFGQNIEPDFYCEEVAGTINAWTATLADVTAYENGDTYALKVPTTNSGTLTININSLGAKRVYDDDGQPLAANKISADEVYCFRYKKLEDVMVLLGQYQAYGYYCEESLDCPFSRPNLGREILQVVSDDSIYSDSLCEQRAKYEVYLSTFMKDVLNLQMMDIPFLDVNQKISYQPKNENAPTSYMVTSISREHASGTMSVSLVRFSEDYPHMDEVYKYMYGQD